jgi:hypothetical protein
MLSFNLVIVFFFTLCCVFLFLINGKDKNFVMFDVQTTCRVSFFFITEKFLSVAKNYKQTNLKLVCFFPLLAGMFHNFELTQNREKTRNGQIRKNGLNCSIHIHGCIYVHVFKYPLLYSVNDHLLTTLFLEFFFLSQENSWIR